MSIGENIKKLRKEKGLTQKQLAKECGLSIATIQGYEQGKYEPKYITLLKLCDILGTNLSEIGINEQVPFSIEKIAQAIHDTHEISFEEIAKKMLEQDSEDIVTTLYREEIDNAIKLLNTDGCYKLKNYAIDLTKIPEYRKDE